jgi:NAD binding domain of 6-phosphogluconate dehydrogenase
MEDDDVIAELVPHLEEGDIIIDGGNSLFTDTSRRFHSLMDGGLRFLGMGVSGGEVGALEGPSMMPGGDPQGYARIESQWSRRWPPKSTASPAAPSSDLKEPAITSRLCTMASNMPIAAHHRGI